MSEKYQWFNGLRFTRDEKTGYYLNATHRKRIHRYVWEFYNGEIPNGYAIHHIDHNKENNDISNLKLMSTYKHMHMHGNEMDRDWLIKNLEENARPAANIWHGSEEGREWHKKHYEEMKDILHEKVERICDFCNKKYMGTLNGKNRFCSVNCKSAWRRKAGIDNETKKCIYCGNNFTTNKYSKAKYCSQSCSNKHNPRRKLRKNKDD